MHAVQRLLAIACLRNAFQKSTKEEDDDSQSESVVDEILKDMHTGDVNRFLQFSGCQIVRENTVEPLGKTILSDRKFTMDMVLRQRPASVEYFVHVLQCNEKMQDEDGDADEDAFENSIPLLFVK